MKPSTHKASVAGVIALAAFLMPAAAAAQATAQTLQVLPPGGTGCAAVPLQAITPHVLNGSLHSFDVAIANTSYIAVLAQVGGEGVPFNYMTRFGLGNGVIKHHVDLQTTPIHGSLPVSLILLSSPQGSPTCLTTIAFSVSPTGTVLAPAAVTGAMGSTGGTSGTATGSTQGAVSAGSSSGTGSSVSGSVGTGTKGTGATSTPGTSSVVAGGTVAPFQNLCVGNNALQLWFLLLAIYVVIAAFTALAKPPLSQKSVALPLTLILVPLVLLLGLWYFVEACRAAGWVPAVSVIIAVAALLVAFRDQNPGVKVISLPAANPKGTAKSTVPVVAQKPATPLVQSDPKSQQKGK